MKKLFLIIAVAALVAGCGGSGHSKGNAADRSTKASNALQNQIYQSKNNIDFRNYNWRLQLSDDPATILWCTFFPPGLAGVSDGSTPGQAFTVPIAGKLTSSNKRPYSDVRYLDAGNYAWYPQQVPDPQHMYGSSSEYRYGFGPSGKADYTEFTNFASVCTTQPKVWQANTPILTGTSISLQSVSNAAEAALRKGDAKQANAILAQAGNVKKSK